MYDIQLSERNIVIEKSKHLGLMYNKITVRQLHREFRLQAFIHLFIHIRCQATAVQ